LRDIRDGGRELTVPWVPGHCGLERNERADERAREGTEMAQQGCSWTGPPGVRNFKQIQQAT